MALNITKKENYHRLYEESTLYIEEGNKEEIDIVETTRVGIDYAEEAINFPWRFYIKNNVYVSKKFGSTFLYTVNKISTHTFTTLV